MEDQTSRQCLGLCLQRGVCRRHRQRALRTPATSKRAAGGQGLREGKDDHIQVRFHLFSQLKLAALLCQVLAPPSREPEGPPLV